MRAGFALLLVLATTGASAATAPSRVLWQGPLLSGESVAWIEDATLHAWSPKDGDRVVYRSDSLAVTRPFAASSSLLAFERAYPGCPPPAGHVCPNGTDALIGPRRGPFRALTRPRTCFLPSLGNALALDGRVVAYVELDCMRQRIRVIVRDGRPRVLRNAPIDSGCCRDIALAGGYVAWGDGGSVAVYDRRSRRIAYRARIARAHLNVEYDFDLQNDGKLAVAFRALQSAGNATSIGWFSPSRPRLHLLPFRGGSTQVRIAGDRVAFATGNELTVSDLVGRARIVARFTGSNRLRGFDFDGRRLAWATDRVTSRRVDCPPPGQGRPCVRRETGVTSIRLDSRLIARLRFEDSYAR